LDKERWYESSASLLRAPGIYRIQIFYRSPTGGPARLQLWWSGKSFAPEPIPAYRFGHLDDEVPEEWRREARIERGRIIVGQFGCAQCHRKAFPEVDDPPAGPLIGRLGDRMTQDWLEQWLENPGRLIRHARMPALFPPGREGFVERSIVAAYLLNTTRSTN